MEERGGRREEGGERARREEGGERREEGQGRREEGGERGEDGGGRREEKGERRSGALQSAGRFSARWRQPPTSLPFRAAVPLCFASF